MIGSARQLVVLAVLVFCGTISSFAAAQPANNSVAADNNRPDRFQRLWTIGTLDPARGKQWPAPEAGQCKLASVEVEPHFVLFTARGNPENPSSIDCYEASDLTAGKSFTPQVLAGGDGARLTFLVDLGRTMPGTIEVEADVPAGTKMTFETGEAMMPTRTYPVAPEANGGRQVFRPVIAHGGWSSLRFAWIHFDKPTGPIIVHRVRGIYQVLSCNYEGDFKCSDDEMTRIWEMCAYSAHAVMGQPLDSETQSCARLQTLCLDRVDRFPWAGDSRVIQTAVLDVFGQYDLVRSNLDGFVPKGTRPIPDLTNIAPYTLDWAIAVMDYYQSSGDAAFLQERLDDLTAVIDKYDPLPSDWKSIRTPPNCSMWMFFDWDKRINSSVDVQTAAAFVGKYVQTCRALAEAATSLNRPETAQHAAGLAQKHAVEWRELYLGEWAKAYDIHAVTNLLLGDVLSTSEERVQAFDTVFADRRKRWTNTPYFGSHVLTALAKIGRQAEAVEMLHDYWGTMIDAGATSVWEEWDPNVRLPVNAHPPQFGPPCTYGSLSLIQPAGVGPARWLLREIVGITPESPGYRRVRIEPHAVGLAWAKGTIATPLGPATASWTDDAKQFRLETVIPAGTESVQLVVLSGNSYKLDGQPVTPQMAANGLATFTTSPGAHVLTVTK